MELEEAITEQEAFIHPISRCFGNPRSHGLRQRLSTYYHRLFKADAQYRLINLEVVSGFDEMK